MLELLKKNWFLFGILLCIIFAEVYPNLGRTGGILAPEWTAKYVAVGLIFLISGVSLSVNDFVVVSKRYKIHCYIQCFTFLVFPLCIFGLNFIISSVFHVNEWILKGLVTVSCMPPPISSAVILTKTVGGNEAAAVFNSVLGSFLGIIITPLSILVFLGSTALVSTLHSVLTLMITVILPLVVGITLRHFKLVDQVQHLPLSTVGQCLLLFIIYSSFCDAFLSYDAPMSPVDVLAAILLVVIIQVTFMYSSFHISLSLKVFTARDIAAITFCSTHKSLTLGLPILRILFSGYSHFSQITLPLLIYHPTQIILGGILVPSFKKWVTINKQKLGKDVTIIGDGPLYSLVGTEEETKIKNSHLIPSYPKVPLKPVKCHCCTYVTTKLKALQRMMNVEKQMKRFRMNHRKIKFKNRQSKIFIRLTKCQIILMKHYQYLLIHHRDINNERPISNDSTSISLNL